MVAQPKTIYEFGLFRLDLTDHLLLKKGKPVSLTPKAFEVLVLLLEARGRLIQKDEMLRTVWADSFVEEANLARTVWMLRRALDNRNGPSYIETIPKLGYRFVAEVTEISSETSAGPLVAMPDRSVESTNGNALPDDGMTPAMGASGKEALPGASIWHARSLLFVAALVVPVLLASVYLWRTRDIGLPANPQIRYLAVLPLEDLSGDPSREYLADGMTEGLVASLSRATTLRVKAPKSTLAYKRTSKSPSQIASELGVDYLVIGSFVKEGDGVRFEPRLVDATTGVTLWSNVYSRGVSDIWALQNEIAREIITKLGMEVQHQANTETQVNPEAYDLFLRGRFRVIDDNPEKLLEAIDFQERATKLDPKFARAFAELAKVCSVYSFYYAPHDNKWAEEAFVAVQQADRLDPDLPELHLARGLGLWTRKNSFPHEQAIIEYRRALELNPSMDEARYQLGRIYMHTGLFDKATAEYQLARAIDPTHQMARFRFAVIANFQGKYEESLSMQNALPRDLSTATKNYQRAWSLCHLNRYSEAAAVVEEWRAANAKDEEGGLLTSIQALLAAHAGDEKSAEQFAKLTVETGSTLGHFHHSSYTIAAAYAVLNKPENAMKWLQFTAENGFPNFPLFSNDPDLDNLRQDPRFIDFMQKQKEQWDQRMKSY